MDYKKFVDEALRFYESLPYETNNLYKRYSINLNMPKKPEQTGQNAEAKTFAGAVSAETGINFDVVVVDDSLESKNEYVKIAECEKLFASSESMFRSDEDKVAAFVHAFAKKAVLIDIPESKDVSLKILVVNSNSIQLPIYIKARKNSKLRLLEFFCSTKNGRGPVAPLHELKAEGRSSVEINVLHNENLTTEVANLFKASAADDSSVTVNLVYLGGAETRARGFLDAAGANSTVNVSEAVFGTGSQRFDINTFITNSKPGSVAMLNSGAVGKGSSRCILKGYAKVENGAKGIKSELNQKGLALDKDAHIEALPDMSIDYSNEVSATHSAGTAPLDKETLFYLMSRGVDSSLATKLTVLGFFSRYLANVSDPVVKDIAIAIMLDKLEKGTTGSMPSHGKQRLWLIPERA